MTAQSDMLVLPSWPAWGEAAVLYGGVLLVWALALYVTSRGEPRRVPVLAALAMTALSVYLFGWVRRLSSWSSGAAPRS